MDERKTIAVNELQEMLIRKEPVFILDVRSTEQRREWRIAESVHVDAYKQLNDGDNTVLDEVQIPANATIVTVCAAGRTSLIASEALQKKGIRAYSLEGGMKAWNYAWNIAATDLSDGVKIVQVRRPAKGVLSYIVGSGSEAVVIDAALHPDVYITLAEINGWRIKYVMDTHIHADFVSRTPELAKVCGAKHLLVDRAKVDFQFSPVAPGDKIIFGSSEIQFIHTPGHTWESTTFKIGDLAAFTGDTLFIDGIGRPDLKADQDEAVEKSRQLYHSLKRLFALPPTTLILPAHTANAISFDGKIITETIGQMKDKLDIFKLDAQAFVDYALSKIPPTPPNYLTIAGLNKKGSHEGHQLADLEAGGNHCAIA